MVTIPVRLYTAVRRRDVRFKEVDRATGLRIRHQRVVDAQPEHGNEIISGEPDEPDPRGGLSSREQSIVEPLAAPSGPRVPRQVLQSDLVRGYEIAPGRLVKITDEDLLLLHRSARGRSTSSSSSPARSLTRSTSSPATTSFLRSIASGHSP